jgi:predicted O-methyltransferase YrrM
MTGRERLRRLRFGLSTLLGIAPRGVFLPHRYAGSLRPGPYPALEPAFRRAEPAMRAILADAETFAPDLARIAAGDGPARFDQDWFPRLDAAAAYALVRRHAPRRILEIGSGHSSRFLARAIRDGGSDTDFVALDPEPRASLAALGIRHEPCLLQDADPALVAALGPGDVLFVDSSHLAMPGSDVDHLAGHILPALPAGVLVHVHDILLPDPYPPEWAWRGYNEASVVAAYLAGRAAEILFSSHWVATRRPDWIADGIVGRLPARPTARDTSLWLRTT